ncbi:hypothetical protein E8M12_12825 [Thalassotalea mangrovi]|uniref:Uncharacterized protein n=1 Tax=Thalassotalea mangrovi TaxID=2572245 RepID=A0A4U1B3V7_9GAMM|nr:hypothetical protein E8M12_12825 [Thalassotalea mangrovi]
MPFLCIYFHHRPCLHCLIQVLLSLLKYSVTPFSLW